MQQCPSAFLVLLGGACLMGLTGAENWGITKEIRQCVRNNLDSFLANYTSSTCPAECADCFTAPLECLVTCANKEAACGCAKDIPLAIGVVKECCDPLWDFLEPACGRALDGLGKTVLEQVTSLCEDINGVLDGEASSTLLEQGSLWDKTRTAFIEGATAVVAGLVESGQRTASTALFQQSAGSEAAELEEKASHKYVNSHGKGAACMEMMEAVENEQATAADDAEPNLKAAADAIVRSTSAVLGPGSPALEAKVHRAMEAAWTESGPGLGAEGICEVLLRHHDGL